MELPNIVEFVIGGFYAALSKFSTEFNLKQEQRDMALNDKLTQVLQNQQASQEAIAALDEAVTKETTQVAEQLTAIANTNTQQSQVITQQSEQIKQLLAQVEEGSKSLQEAETTIDSILQQQQQQLAEQQEAIGKISAIFTPPSAPAEAPTVSPTT